MKNFNIYLNFDGNLEEAFNFYREVFGGEYIALKKYLEMPHADSLAPEDREKVMHAELKIEEEIVLMGCDILEAWGQTITRGTNFYINITPDSVEEAHLIFNKLSAGGEVQMPLQKTFWGAFFGTVTDRFQTQWMINLGV